MIADPGFWHGKKVLVTGHTGFKGAWLTIWLHDMGAQVTGYALSPPTDPSLYQIAAVDDLVNAIQGDVRDAQHLQAAIDETQPEIIFHLAAQSLVRESYAEPIQTYETNIMGTLHLLEAARHCASVKAIVNVTSDKCYDNKERATGYVEEDAMGGHDPYSSSKGCAELVTAAYRKSYLAECGIAVATARAGNVIGGGDWAEDRLIPDFFRAIDAGRSLQVRFPEAIRPWQHVLDPLGGYLLLAERLYNEGAEFAEAWNFGPPDSSTQSVAWILEILMRSYKDFTWETVSQQQPHEALLLTLSSEKSSARLGWSPVWELEVALQKIVSWHEAWQAGDNILDVTRGQIKAHQAAAGSP